MNNITPKFETATILAGNPVVPMRYSDAALPLYDHGWAPIPLASGNKNPVARWKGWNNTRPLREHIQRLARSFPESAVGIAVPPNVFVVDADILDESIQREVVRAARDTLGKPRMLRVGRWPKLMLWYGTEQPGELRSRKLHPIELFSGSGQVVVSGIHHHTGRPYGWGRTVPTVVSPADIEPKVSQVQVNAFLAAIEPSISGMKRKLAARYGQSHIHKFGVDALVALREEFKGRVEWYLRHDGENRRGALRAAAIQMLRQAVPPDAGAGDRHFRLLVITEALVWRGWKPDAVLQVCAEVFAENPELYPDYEPGHWQRKALEMAIGAASRCIAARRQVVC